jgi:hypothetical protein
LLDDLICLKPHPSLSKCLITNLAACPLSDTCTDPILFFSNSYYDLTTIVISNKLHRGLTEKISITPN